MKSPVLLIKNRKALSSPDSRRGERGVTMILIALAMVAIIAMAALSIDVVSLYLARSEAQRSADAAALAAARVISVSGVTGDPTNASTYWGTVVCPLATQVATTVATQNTVGGAAANPVTVSFLYNGGTVDCTAPSTAFAVNPQVQVQVQRTGLPSFFARIWSRGSNSISATAVAEAFNPSGSSASALGTVPVQPRCVKPWVVPNRDPLNAVGCTGAGCQPFVNLANGSIRNPGISLGGSSANGVVGETFNLFPDCRFGATCNLRDNPPVANRTVSGVIPPQPNLEYLPGQTQFSSTAVPSAATACGSLLTNYAHAVAGCDQRTVYHCGVQNLNTVDLSENPRTRDTTRGVQCLIQQDTPGLGNVSGQDTMDDTVFPFQMKAGSNNPLGIANTQISTSNSIVSLPIYDHTAGPIAPAGQTSVTIVGFLQVFINSVDNNGAVNVTVLNVAGCGNNVAGTAVAGSSPVPVRLITQP